MAKVLLAEDDVNLREIFEMRLKAEGYEVVTAGDGEEALVVATKELPDLIVVDVMMPKISGFEMLETLRSNPQTAGVKAIMMTALGQAEDRERGQKLGVLKYLVKSQVTLEDFVKSIHEILDSNQTNNQQRSSMDPTQQPTQDDSMPQAPAPDPMAQGPATPPAAAPAADAAESTAQEQGEVQEQIDHFASSPEPASSMPPPAEPATDMPASTDAGASEPASPPAMPAGDSDTGQAMNVPTPEAPAGPEPAASGDTPNADGSTTPGSMVEPGAQQGDQSQSQ